jgi:hypothetical protein
VLNRIVSKRNTAKRISDADERRSCATPRACHLDKGEAASKVA